MFIMIEKNKFKRGLVYTCLGLLKSNNLREENKREMN